MRLVLVHGAWQGGWSFERLLPSLAAAGFETVVVDLPGNGTDDTPPGRVTLDLYARHVVDRIGGRAALLAHSGGGVVASAVAEAEPDRIAGIVYVAGLMLPDATSFADVVAPLAAADPAAAGIRPHLVWSADGLTSAVPPPAAERIFFHDAPPALAAAAAARLTPQPEGGRAVAARLSPDRFGRVPRLYVEASLDRSVVPAAQRRMQALVPGADIVCLESGHAPQLSRPNELAAAAIPWLNAHP